MDFSHIVFADETNYTGDSGRFGAVALLSLSVEDAKGYMGNYLNIRVTRGQSHSGSESLGVRVTRGLTPCLSYFQSHSGSGVTRGWSHSGSDPMWSHSGSDPMLESLGVSHSGSDPMFKLF